MVDYLKEIDNGLIIEKPKIVLHWSLQKKDFFDKLISSFDEFVENDFTSNFDDTNEYVDIKVLDDILKSI